MFGLGLKESLAPKKAPIKGELQVVQWDSRHCEKGKIGGGTGESTS